MAIKKNTKQTDWALVQISLYFGSIVFLLLCAGLLKVSQTMFPSYTNSIFVIVMALLGTQYLIAGLIGYKKKVVFYNFELIKFPKLKYGKEAQGTGLVSMGFAIVIYFAALYALFFTQ